MLFKILDTIRQKPKPIRDQYALLIAVGCTILIGGVWSFSLPSRLAQTSMAAVGAASTTMPTTPFAGLIQQFKDQFKNTKETLPAVPVNGARVEATSSTMRETEAALNLQISEENRLDMQNSTATHRATSTGYGFATTSIATPTILIATSSATTAE